MPKKPRVRTLMNGQLVKGCERLLNLHSSIFVIFFDNFAEKSSRKVHF